MKLKVMACIHVPRVPNFVRYGSEDGQMFDVADLDDKDLKQIGAAWTADLIAHAHKRRKTASTRESK